VIGPASALSVNFLHNAARRIMPHGLIDGRQRLTGHAAGSA
jgi:hypothetical protein